MNGRRIRIAFILMSSINCAIWSMHAAMTMTVKIFPTKIGTVGCENFVFFNLSSDYSKQNNSPKVFKK